MVSTWLSARPPTWPGETGTPHSDDPINPACILAKYARETGDCSILEEVTPYAHTDGRRRTRSTTT
jgi:cellobiose phosphorylase